MNSTTNLRTTNPRGRPNPLAELSIDHLRAYRQMRSRVLDSVGSPGLRHQISGDAAPTTHPTSALSQPFVPSYEKAQMRRAMIKMNATRASPLLSCSATSISSTPMAPVRLNDGQIVSAAKAAAVVIIRVSVRSFRCPTRPLSSGPR